MAELDYDGYAAPDRSGGGSAFLNWLGALMSLALVVGLGLWGWQMTVRSVAEVPVIRKLEGPARIAPDDPGGRRAAHQGLSVNQIQAEGSAEGAATRVILAPKPIDLTQDTVTPTPASLPVVVDPAPVEQPTSPVVAVTPLDQTPQPAEPTQPVELAALDQDVIAPAAPRIEVIPASVPGVARSMRPVARPELNLASYTARAPQPTVQELDPSALPSGTRLVQLGAFDSAETARSEWARLSGQFSAYMSDKARVIQRAESNGRIFYRLRAHGFSDLSDARRFCTVLLAEKAACIPVAVR